MGISWDHWPERGLNARTEGEMNLSSGLLLSKDGLNWTLYGDLHVFVEKVTPHSTNGLAEPSIVQLADGEIYHALAVGQFAIITKREAVTAESRGRLRLRVR